MRSDRSKELLGQWVCREAIARALDERSRYGEPGSRIPGTSLRRAYCYWCGVAIRVPYDATVLSVIACGAIQCESCNGDRKRLMPGGYAGPIDDITGYEANAVRAMEGD